MATSPRTLDELLEPLNAGEFFSTYLGKSFFHLKGSPGKFAGLLPWPDLNRILEQHQLDTPRLRLVREGEAIAPESYVAYQSPRRGSSRRIPRLRAPGLTRHLKEGATLIVDSIEEMQQPIRTLAEDLESVLRARIQVNMYAGWRKCRGFDVHWDGHDVLILQVAGRKQWGIYGTTREFPLAADDKGTPPEKPVWEGMLEAGDLLYIPRGCWHVAVPLDEPTLHLTVGLHHATGMDFVTWFVDRLRERPAVRQDLPRFASESGKEAHLERMRAAWTEAWHPGLMDEYLAYVDGRSAPRPHFGLPWTAMPAATVLEDIAVKWIASRPVDWDRGRSNGVVKITSNGKEWTFAAEALPLLRTMQARRACGMDELLAASAGALAPEAVRAFVNELVEAGLATIVRRRRAGR